MSSPCGSSIRTMPGRAPALLAIGLVVAFASPVRAEDLRVEKARQIRDQILEKRRQGTAPDPRLKEDPFEAAVLAARERLAAIDQQIEDKRRRSEAMASPREKLSARSDELARAVSRQQEENRARVESIYRSAKLGAGAAGWHPDPARSARLSRYLAAVATEQQKKLEVVEIEHGSVIASLDKARAEDQASANELHVLGADRAEVLASLDRAIAEAAEPGQVVASADTLHAADVEALADESGAPADEAAARAEEEALERAVAQTQGRGAEPHENVAADPESAERVQRALELLAERTGKPVREPAAGAAGPAKAGDDLSWPDPVHPDGAAPETGVPTATRAKDLPASDADRIAAARAEVEKAAAEKAKAESEARAEAEKAAKAEADKAAKADALAKAVAAAEAAKKAENPDIAADQAAAAALQEDERTQPASDRDSPPAGAASPPAQVAAAPTDPAQPGGAAEREEPPKRPNLLSRIFGSDREADAFAATKGKLPPPVAGKVVANYGQQHKSGATYRGVILRAGHNAPIKAVAGGKVSFAGEVPGLGNTVIVSHGGRYHTVYARLGSLNVKEGESVTSGTSIGALPDDNADMHFELRDQGKAIDPVPWLKEGIPGAPQ